MKKYIFSPQHGFMYESPKVKGSRFIGIVFQVYSLEDVRQYMEDISSRYPDASHGCYAYKIGSKEKSSDAGEPAGTAGKPILFAIQQSGYDNVLVVVIRHFGGTLLGAGGLVRAYGQCARDVLDKAPVQKEELLQKISLACSYDDMAIVMQCVDICQGKIVSQEAGLLLRVVFQVNVGLVDRFVDMIQDKSGGRIEIVVNY